MGLIDNRQSTIDNRGGGASIDVTYTGFTPEAQDAFQFAVDTWASLMVINVEIRLDARLSDLGQGILASTFAPSGTFDGSPLPDVAYVSALADQLAGEDLFPGQFDILMDLNSEGIDWYFGTDARPGAEQIDFVSIVLHEMGHGLGWADSFDVNPADGQGSWPTIPQIYDTFVENALGESLIDTDVFPNPSLALGAAIQDPLFFGGSKSKAANNGNRPALYAPDPFELDSSVGHLDDFTFGPSDPNALMRSTLEAGEAHHDPGSVGLAVFQDLGWNTLVVPTLNFAQFGNAGDPIPLQSDIVVFNPNSSESAVGTVNLFDAAGNPLDPAGILAGGSADFELPPLNSRTFSTTAAGDLIEGSATITSDNPISGVIRFQITGAGIAGVGSSIPLTDAIVPARLKGTLSTGVAIRNTTDSEITVDLTLKTETGIVLGNASRTIAPNGRVSEFINCPAAPCPPNPGYFPGVVPDDFSGTVCISSQGGRVAVIALEFDIAGRVFTTLPVSARN